MSEDFSSKPDLTTKVKYERGEMEERMVDIYESADTLRSPGPEEDPPRITAGHQRAESVPPQRRSFRAAAVCLGLLCVLLLAGITGLKLYFITVMEDNIRDREQIITRYNNTLTELMKENTSLEGELTKAIQEKTNLINNLIKERGDLQRKLNYLFCSKDWPTFGSSCYNVSTEWKTWEESRQDCRERGADLVIINSRKKLDFIHNLKKFLWIGLSDSEEEGIWKWVDGTRLPEEHKFWRTGEPNGEKRENCVEQQHSTAETIWNDLRCTHTRPWVCERNITL